MSSFKASPTRQRFLAKFEPSGDGYLYRRSPDAVPVRISAKDHQFMVDAFDTGWFRFPFIAVLAVACVAILIFLGSNHAGSAQGHILRDIAFPMSGFLFVVAWYVDLWDEADRALFRRATEMGKTKSLPWLTKSASDTSWKSIVFAVFWGLSSAGHILGDAPDFWDKFIFCFWILGVSLCLLFTIRKIQLNRSRSLPYLNKLH